MDAQLLRTVRVLVNAHADVIAADNSGFTVLHHCAKQGAAEYVYKLLLQHGAVPTAVDVNGSTPAHIAGMSGHFADEALRSKAAVEYSKVHTNCSDARHSAANSVTDSDRQQCDRCSNTGSNGTSSCSSSSSAASKEVSSATRSTLRSSTRSSSCEAVDSSAKHKKQKVKQPCAIVNCKKLTTKLCRRCAAVYYCSTECQKVCLKDAKHKAQCEEIASAIV
jgi:ankyrin repeat protein